MFMILTVKKNRLPNICSEFVFVFFFIFIYLFPIELNLHKDTNLDWNLQCPSGFLHTSIHLLITLFFIVMRYTCIPRSHRQIGLQLTSVCPPLGNIFY